MKKKDGIFSMFEGLICSHTMCLLFCLNVELILLGFVSLLLTVSEKPIANICIPKSVGETFLPCGSLTSSDSEEETKCVNQVKWPKITLFV